MVAPVGSLVPGLDSGALFNLLNNNPPKGLQMSRREWKQGASTTSEGQAGPGESGPEGAGSSVRVSSGGGGGGTSSSGLANPSGQTPLRDKPAYLIRWNRFEEQVCNAFAELFCSDHFVDVTLACEGELMKAHKIVLAMSSPFFRQIFQETPCKHPVVIIKGMAAKTLRSILQYLYLGEVILNRSEINNFMDAADYLSICGVLANLYSCDIKSTTTSDQGTPRESESEGTSKPQTSRASDNDNDDSTEFRESHSEPSAATATAQQESQVIKFHGVKSRWTRRYSNTSYHGTPTNSSPVLVETKRSASAGEIEMLSECAETIPVPESHVGMSKSITGDHRIERGSDVEMVSGTDEERYDECSSIPEGAVLSSRASRKVIQRTYPHDYNVHFDDSSDAQLEDWRVQSGFASSGHLNPSVLGTPSERSLRPVPYPLGAKDFSHPLQVSVDSHQSHLYSSSSSPGGPKAGVVDHSKPKSHSASYSFSSSLPPHQRSSMYRGEPEEFVGPHSSSSSQHSHMTLLTSQSREERAAAVMRYRLSAGPSTSTAPTTFRHHQDYSRAHLLSTHSHSYSFPEIRPRPTTFEESSGREVGGEESRFRSESLESGAFTRFSGAKDLLSGAGGYPSGLPSKPHSFPSASDLSVPGSQRYSSLGFMSQIRSPSSSTAGSSGTRPKTKAIRSSQVPQSSRYTAAEVDQMVEAVANYPGNIVPCTLCQKFVKRERLRAHIHECHLLTGEKIICPHCGIALKSKGSFRVHIWRHKRGTLPTRNSMSDFGKGLPPSSGPASH